MDHVWSFCKTNGKAYPADNGPSSQVQYIYKRLIIKAFTEEPRGTDAFSKPKVG